MPGGFAPLATPFSRTSRARHAHFVLYVAPVTVDRSHNTRTIEEHSFLLRGKAGRRTILIPGFARGIVLFMVSERQEGCSERAHRFAARSALESSLPLGFIDSLRECHAHQCAHARKMHARTQ